MGLLTFVGRIVLVVLNIIFIFASLALIICGFILRFADTVIRPFLKTVLDQLESTAKNVYGDTNFNTENLEFGSLVSALAAAMITVGVILLAVSFVACCGACYNIGTIMIVYAIALVVILLAQLIAIILAFGAPGVLKNNIKSQMETSLAEYDGIKGTTITAIGWNWAMQEYKCCGATDHTDFDPAGKWKDNDAKPGDKVVVPVACCKTLPAAEVDIKACAGLVGDTMYELEDIKDKSNYDKGCVDAIWAAVVTDNSASFLTVVGLCMACQVALIIFAVLVYKDRGISGGLI